MMRRRKRFVRLRRQSALKYTALDGEGAQGTLVDGVDATGGYARLLLQKDSIGFPLEWRGSSLRCRKHAEIPHRPIPDQTPRLQTAWPVIFCGAPARSRIAFKVPPQPLDCAVSLLEHA